MNRKTKVRLFRATVESVLLYNSETWTINKNMQKRINGCYTRMLRMATNTSWKEKTTNEVLYQDLQPLSQTIRERRMRLAGHFIRHTTEMAHNLVLCEPARGKRNRGWQPVTYIDCLKEGTGLTNTDEIRTAIMARNEWKKCVELGPVGAQPK